MAGKASRERKRPEDSKPKETGRMPPVTPVWCKQRQAKAEDAGPDTIHVTGPNLREAWLGIRKSDSGQYAAFVRGTADGPDVDATEPVIRKAYDAWEAAFELYRQRMVI